MEYNQRIPCIGPTDGIFSMGSCFSDHMATLLKERKMDVTCNPFGIIYNPVAMQTLFKRIANAAHYSEKDVFKYRGLYRTLETHSVCADISAERTINLLNIAVDKSNEALTNAAIVLLTFGTSIVHVHKEQGKVVANNHTLPSAAFTQKQLSAEEVINAVESIVQTIQSVNANAVVLFTLSPVRHIRSGLIANARSKAVLLEAIHQVADKYAFCHYFPAYEYLIDELRDYRFYKEDLIHPTDMAIQLVWQHFIQAVMQPETLHFIKDMEQLLAAKQHRLLHPETTESRKFIQSQLAFINQLRLQYPFLRLDAEEQHFHSISSS